MGMPYPKTMEFFPFGPDYGQTNRIKDKAMSRTKWRINVGIEMTEILSYAKNISAGLIGASHEFILDDGKIHIAF